jgi:hypothetical protein
MQHFVKADGPAPGAPMAAELAAAPAVDTLQPQQTTAASPDLHAPPGNPGISTNLRV